MLGRHTSEEAVAQDDACRPAESQEDMTAAVEKIKLRLRPNEQDIQDQLNQVAPRRKKVRKGSGAKPVHVPEEL